MTKTSIRIVTNAITTSATATQTSTLSGPFRLNGGAGQSFVDLLDLGDSPVAKILGNAADALSGDQPAASARTALGEALTHLTAGLGVTGDAETAQTAEPSAAEAELTDLLGTLYAKLDELSEKLDGEKTLDDAEIAELGELLGQIEALLADGTPLPSLRGPGAPLLESLAERLGLPSDVDITRPSQAFELLSGLAAGLADGLREQSPELAARLTDLTKTLDARTAEIQTAAKQASVAGVIDPRQIESETRLNPAAAIAAAQADGVPDASDPAQIRQKSDAKAAEISETGERSLTRSDASGAQNAAGGQSGANTNGSGTGAGSGQNTGGDGSTAPTPAELDAPDGLITQAPGTAAQPPAPGAAVRPETALYQRPDTQINFPHIAAEISRHVHNGTSRFEIRLNPAELGRIDVRMEMDQSGNVVARLAVERTETLDLLQRDQKALMRALAEAGMDASKTDLQFSLNQEGQKGSSSDEGSPWRTSLIADTGADATAAPATGDTGLYTRGYARLDAVNLWV